MLTCELKMTTMLHLVFIFSFVNFGIFADGLTTTTDVSLKLRNKTLVLNATKLEKTNSIKEESKIALGHETTPLSVKNVPFSNVAHAKKVTSLDCDLLRTFSNQITLNLSANAITKINLNCTKLNNLKSLDLSFNKLQIINASEFNILHELLYLNLSNNQIKSISDTNFNSGLKLQQIDLSFNLLTTVANTVLELPSLTRVLLNGNKNLGERSKSILLGTRLQILDASNTGLSQIPSTLTPSIRNLRLSDNKIKTVTCGDLDSFPLLQILDLKSNNICNIEDDALGRLETLTILYLTRNRIGSVPKSLPDHLTVLHLEHNLITKVSQSDFLGQAKMEVLLLSDNRITTIEAGAFGQLLSLVTLDLSRNKINFLGPGSFSGPQGLQVLRLSSIKLTNLTAKDMSFPLLTPDQLLTLDLSNSSSLAKQFLGDSAALAASRQLQELDLTSSSLEVIPNDLLFHLPQLRLLHLGGNNLNCSNLHWLGTWMRLQDLEEYNKITCASPPELWGTCLVDLQEPVSTLSSIKNIIESTTEMQTKPKETFSLWSQSKENSSTSKVSKEIPSDKIETRKSISSELPFWNDTIKTSSMHSSNQNDAFFIHPGLIIFATGVLTCLATLVMFAVKLRWKKRQISRDFQSNIEVSSLSSVSELW